MTNFIKQEIKNAITWRILAFTAIMFLINVICIFTMKTDNIHSILIPQILGTIPFFLLFVSAEIFSKDYIYETYKYVYTSFFSREKIALFKMISVFIISICSAIIASALLILFTYLTKRSIDYREMFEVIVNIQVSFMLYALLLISTSFFISIITKKFLTTVMIMYILFLDIFTPLILGAIDKIQESIVKDILKNIPYLYAAEGIQKFHYSWQHSYIILSFSIILIIFTLYVLKRRDL